MQSKLHCWAHKLFQPEDSPRLFSYLNHSVTARENFFTRDRYGRAFSITYEQKYIPSNDTTHEQNIICRQLFASHVGWPWANEKMEKCNRMIITVILQALTQTSNPLLKNNITLLLVFFFRGNVFPYSCRETF